MNTVFPLPLYSFFKTVVDNGGLWGRGFVHALPWLLKTTLAEPLRWIELSATSQRIKSYNIESPPIFILGYYRSGTTYLQQCFMQDTRFGYMSLYQTIFPELMLCFEKIMTPPLEFIARITGAKNPFHRIPLTWHSTGEEDIGMTSMISPYASAWGFLFPQHMQQYFEKYFLLQNATEDERTNWKMTYSFLLKKLSLANDCKPLVLKNPPNTARIKLLLSIFPSARFVFIYRDPYDVFASTKRMLEMVRKEYILGKSQDVNFKEIILKTFSAMMTRYLQDKNLIPQGQLIEIRYEDFIRSPVETTHKIYDSLQLDDFSLCEKAMTAFCESQKNYAVLRHNLSAEETKAVSENWEPFIRHWNYPLRND